MRVLNGISRWLNKPIAYPGLTLSDLKRFLESFLLQLSSGSVLILDRETNPGFLQLAITDRHDQWLEVEFGLPDDEWSREQFDTVHAAMASAGYNTEVEINHGTKGIPRFLRVHVQGNRRDLTPTLLQLFEIAATTLEFGVRDRYTLQMLGDTDPAYTNELATRMEQLPRGGWFASTIAKYLRRLAQREEAARSRDKFSKK